MAVIVDEMTAQVEPAPERRGAGEEREAAAPPANQIARQAVQALRREEERARRVRAH
jgi:hypothetical protein